MSPFSCSDVSTVSGGISIFNIIVISLYGGGCLLAVRVVILGAIPGRMIALPFGTILLSIRVGQGVTLSTTTTPVHRWGCPIIFTTGTTPRRPGKPRPLVAPSIFKSIPLLQNDFTLDL